MVLLYQEPQNIQRLPARKPVAFLLEILVQERQQLREFLLRRRQPRATPVEIVKNLRIRLIFLLRPDLRGTNFSQKRFIFGADGLRAHLFHAALLDSRLVSPCRTKILILSEAGSEGSLPNRYTEKWKCGLLIFLGSGSYRLR